MERFYIVTPESELYDEYEKYWSDANTMNEIVKEFMPEHHIETTSYYADGDSLWIVPTKSDDEKFKTQLIKNSDSNGLRKFKANSKIGKAWVARLNGFRPKRKPFVQFYFTARSGGGYRVFKHNGMLYCSYSCDSDFLNPEGFTEIKGSEFYKIMEEAS